jgi:hypothetical protein
MPYLCVLIYFVFFAGVAMTIAEGLWSNAIALMAILICGPLAIAAGYPLGLFIQEKMDKPVEQTWFFIFGGVWLVFFFSIMVFRVFADRVSSRVRMKFVPPLETATGPLMGLGVAVMFASFLTFTLATIPIEAGEWKLPADGWQRTTIVEGSKPFNTVLGKLAGKEIQNFHIQ